MQVLDATLGLRKAYRGEHAGLANLTLRST